jgi:hypothetical protein
MQKSPPHALAGSLWPSAADAGYFTVNLAESTLACGLPARSVA